MNKVAGLLLWCMCAYGLSFSLSAQSAPHFMAYYYPWYNEGHWSQGYWRAGLQPAQRPLLGEYNGRDRAVIQQHLAWSAEYGIDSWALSWWGRRSWSDGTIKRFILPEIKGKDTRFCIFYESTKLLGGLKPGGIPFEKRQIRRMKRDFRYLSRHFFDHPNYLKIEGKAVVVLYLTRTFYGRYAEALQAARTAARKQGFELYLIGDEVFWSMPNRQRIRQLDAITAYNMHGPARFAGYPAESGFFEWVGKQYRRFQEIAQRENVDFIPNVMPGFNDRGVRPEVRHYVIPPQATEGGSAVSTLQQYLDVARPLAGSPLDMITITSFNEWHEDTQIEPAIGPAAGSGPVQHPYTYPSYGMQYLELLREY
ncbi:MAG: hypothetical protein GVY26_14705 [Bacteroidetes bacterium]|nr:hypothetical protein [Bacteroidota bacterium]